MGRAGTKAALQAENARLRERLRLLEGAIENIGHGLCMFDPQGGIALSNRRYAEVIGHSPEQVRPGMTLRDLVELSIEAGYYGPDTDPDELSAAHWTRAAAPPEERAPLERGGRSYAIQSGVTEDGFLVATFDDVTEKLAAEASLRESEARLRAILDEMPDSVKIFDEAAQLTYINPRGLEMIEAPDLAAFTASKHMPVSPEHLPQWLETHDKVIAGESVIWSYDIVGLNGGRRHMEAHSAPIRLPDGTQGHMCISRDVTERRKAEDALRQNEAFLSAVVETTPACIKVVESDGTVRQMNSAGLRMIGAKDFASIEGESVFDLVAPEHRADWREKHARVCAGESLAWQSDIIGPDGALLQTETHAAPIKLPDGRSAHLAITHDITNRTRAERALRESEQRLRVVQEATGLADFVTSEEGIVSSSGRFFEQIGLPPRTEPIKFAEWLEHVHPDDRKWLHEEVLRAMREEDRIACEFRIVRADTGEVRWLATHTAVERNEAGEVIGTIGAHLDITDRKRAEEALRDSERRLQAILISMPDCVKIFDRNSRITYINPRGLEVLEAPDLETFTSSGHVPVSPEYLSECIEVHQRVLAGETVVWNYEIVGMNGGRCHVEAHSVPIRLPDGSQGHMCISRDITERKRAEDALRRSEERLRLVQDVTGLADFEAGADGVAHFSSAMLRQFGLPEDSCASMKVDDWLHLIHPDDRERFLGVERSLGSADTAACEFRIIRADTGEVRWISCKLQIERDAAGGVVRSIGAHLDITDRKRAEEALREGERRLQAILTAMPDCVKIFDEKLQLTYINPAGLELLEADSLDELTASSHVSLPPEHIPKALDVHRKVMAGESVVWDYDVLGMKGRRRHVEAHSVPFGLPDGTKAHLCITRDITERKRAEDALRRSEERLRLAQDATGMAEFETGDDGQMIGSDRFFEQLGLAVPEGPLDAKAWAARVHPDDVRGLIDAIEGAVARQEEHFSGEFRIVRADTGETRWIACNTKMEFAEDGTLVRTIGAHLDITERKHAEMALKNSERRLRLVHEATGLADFEAGPDGVAHVSEALIDQLGLPPGTTELPFDELLRYVHPEDVGHLRQEIESSLQAEDTFQCEFRVVHGVTGEVRWIYSRTKMERNESGTPVRSIGAHLDITERKRVEEALRESEERFRLAAEAAALGVWDYDEAEDTREWSDRLREIFGVPVDATPSLELAAQCVHPDDRADFMRQLNEVKAGNVERFEMSFRINRADDGRERWLALNGWRTHKGDASLRRIILTVRDVTEEKTAEERVRWSASHDPLTRLANRALFQEKLDAAIAGARHSGETVGVLLLDLDHFKQINDSLGHDVGDALLKMFAERLRSVVRQRDTVARLGGDEFAIVVPRLRGKDDLLRLSRSIQERMRAPFVHGGRVLDCRVSSGASMFPDHARSPKEVLKCADTALYAAKAAGRATVTLYEPYMRDDLRRRVTMVQLARNAIDDDRVIPYYQPKLDLQSGRVEGFEALLRWRNGKGRICHPAALEAAFEDLEVAAAISDRMIDRVIADMRGWLDRGVAFRHVAVNASAAEFRRDNFAERVLESLRRADIPTRCFQLEVTETVFLGRGAEYVHRALALLNTQGVKIALDDFGTGYASLRHLKQFPVDLIKIDQSFVRDMEADPGDEAIVRAVINLGKSLGIAVVAEGIEATPQVERLQRLGCDFGQGFLFSKAVGASRVPPLVGKWQREGEAALARADGGLRLVASRP